MLGLVVTDELYRSQPDLPEGQLAKLRASVVNMTSLAGVARRLGDGGIGPHLLLGRGEETTGGREKDSILADALEALIGAVHLGCGLDAAGGDRAPAVRPAAGRGRHPRRRPGLEDQPPGARRRPRAWAPRLRGRGRRSRPRQDLHRRRSSWPATVHGTRHRAHQEGRRAGGRRGRLARRCSDDGLER